MRCGWPTSIFEDRKDFFFEKKKQKTFTHVGPRQTHRARQVVKVFWFFFFKKERLLMSAPVVVVGSLNMDLVMRVPRMPLPGETLSGRGFAMAEGGKGANQAVAAARLRRTRRDDRQRRRRRLCRPPPRRA